MVVSCLRFRILGHLTFRITLVYTNSSQEKVPYIQIYKHIIRTGKVAHPYNLSYLEARDQEDHSSRPAQAKFLGDPHLN
jgi:hypothetical protein